MKSGKPMTTVTEINKKPLGFICLSILILMLLFGLWPFNLNPVNHVFWLNEKPGVRFTGRVTCTPAGTWPEPFRGGASAWRWDCARPPSRTTVCPKFFLLGRPEAGALSDRPVEGFAGHSGPDIPSRRPPWISGKGQRPGFG